MIARVFIIFDLTPQSVRALLGTIVGKVTGASDRGERARIFRVKWHDHLENLASWLPILPYI